MSLRETLIDCVTTSLWLSWVAILLLCLTSPIVLMLAPRPHRWLFFASGMLGGLAGEFCGTSALFLGLWHDCLAQGVPCNTAQGDMGLLITTPLGSVLGSLLGPVWTWVTLELPPASPWAWVSRYTGRSRVLNWTCTLLTPVVLCISTTMVVVRCLG